ncbi:MAG: 5'-nucleotidase, lipoprotein e(P4) family [[Chlorobium] sp. 445]|nr:MAG: 5'-nucleotidase, lipoprotein e(P4) family [[Chlorobium] sp. 445]
MNKLTFGVLLLLGIGVFLFVFNYAREQAPSEPVPRATIPLRKVVQPAEKTSSLMTHAILATLWMQHSGEAMALCYQAYSLAKLRLDEILKAKAAPKSKPKAIVVDVDETVLDNSLHQGKLIKNDTTHPAYWDEWCSLALAKPVPGAAEFLNYAKSKNVEVFYITNRGENLREATLRNFRSAGFPYADSAHLLMRQDVPGKEARRQLVAQKFDIVLLCGDNLNDFSEVFERKSESERNDEVERLKSEFGKRFIVLPNPIYGDWENAIVGYDKLPDSVRIKKRLNAVLSY